MKYSAIGPISVYLPKKIETNEDLQREHPNWNLDAIVEKTGIRQRHVAAEGETSGDLAVKAASQLFEQYSIEPQSIDYLLLCTQTPDYFLPTTACLVQDRIGMRTSSGALDFNLGCSGFVYGLSLANGLIRAGDIRRCLLITAETYTKLIDAGDRSLRTIFGDAAAATLIEAVDEPSLHSFNFGTDGRGGDTLLVRRGGFRDEEHAIRPRHKHRWKSRLYMDGPSLINFGVGVVPDVVDSILQRAQLRKDQIDLFLMHQATRKMLEQMSQRLKLEPSRVPLYLESVGNTVSATIPLLIHHLRQADQLTPAMTTMMLGFGVGWSWAGCIWNDLLAGQPLSG